MALRLREITLRLDEDSSCLPDRIASLLGLDNSDIRDWSIVREGLDARRKSAISKVYTVDFSCADESAVLFRNRRLKTLGEISEPVVQSLPQVKRPLRVLIVGMGPAGLFSALTLAESGVQVCLIERGRKVAERLLDVRRFRAGGPLDPESNIQFGEGGAGTFSDGKLTCRLNHPATRTVLRRLVEFGAPGEILVQAKPHIGSDRLRAVLVNFRKHLLKLGVEIRFSSRLTALDLVNGKLCAGIVNNALALECDALILATGHSARDTYACLAQQRIALERKAFAVGLRVEHPLELINRIQYGRANDPRLPAADYRLTWNDGSSGRGVYSFCMCPGGWVVNASSEPGHLAVNGMSDYRRDAAWSNSALVVTVGADDFPGREPLAGIAFQRRWERAAYAAGGGNWLAPAQPLSEYLTGKGGWAAASCRPGVVHADLRACLPVFVDAALRRALPVFDRRMRGFISPDAMLIGVETRTSAPLRILRDAAGESISAGGLFPAGEGAGYAGGIMSAALDGIRVASNIIERANNLCGSAGKR